MANKLLFILLIGLVANPAFGSSNWQRVSEITDALDGATPHQTGLKLNLPLVAENAGEVPLALSFEGELKNDERITRIRVFAPSNPLTPVIDFNFHSARAIPDVSTRIRLSQTQTVYALAISNQDRFWLAEHEIRVAESGCLMVEASTSASGMSNPRIALPRNPQAGQPGQLRTLINHPMETGIRTDGTEAPPQNLVESLQVNSGDQPLFSAHFYTGTSANPYVQFTLLVAEQPEQLRFIWKDQRGEYLREERELAK